MINTGCKNSVIIRPEYFRFKVHLKVGICTMKTKFLALSIAACLATTSFVANAALEQSATFGVRGGWAHLYSDDSNAIDVSEEDGYGVGLYGEYNFTNWFGLGVGFNYFDGFEYKRNASGATGDIDAYAPEIYARFAYSFDDKGSDIFARAGLAYFFADPDNASSEESLAPVIGVGAQYAFTKNFSARVGYDYYFNTYDKNGVDSDLGYLYAGFQFTFGGPSVAAPAPVAAPQTVRITESHSLDAQTLFPFDGSELSAQGKQAVDQVVADSAKLSNTEFEVYGYTDRIGSDAYNQKLSEKRANAVAAELNAAGVTSLKTVEGRGKANPVTGNKCDSVKGKQAVIDCLAPDRRVEIVVSGDITKEQQI